MRARIRTVALLLALATLPTACGGPQKPEAEALEQSDFHYQLAANHYRAREIPQAIAELERSLEINDRNPDALFLMGFIFHGRRDFVKAESFYRRAIAARPEWNEANNNLGALLLELKQWEEAAEIFERLTNVSTYNTPGHAHNNLGWAYYNMGRTREALEQFQLAVMFQPEHCLAYNNQGLAWEKLGDTRQAMKAFETSIKRCTDYQEPRYRLGVLLLGAGEVPRARALLEECVKLGAETPIGERCSEYLETR